MADTTPTKNPCGLSPWPASLVGRLKKGPRLPKEETGLYLESSHA
jgi:hypothetical protein